MSSHYDGFMTEFRSGNGAAWLDLLSSLSGRYRESQVDDVGEASRLTAWLRANDLEPTDPVTDDDVEAVQETREALHRVTLAAIRGERPDASDLEALDLALSYDAPPRLVAADDCLTVVPPRTARQALAMMVRDAVGVLAGADLAHLHTCGDETCSSVFLDRTGRRRWCTDLSCGNRARVRAYRAQRARTAKD